MKLTKRTTTRSLPGLALAAALAAAAPARAEDNLRLEWIIQGQFAGELIALDKGYYKAAGADIKLLPAGSDIKPAVTVAQGSDTFGIGHPNQVIMARSHGAPLVTVTQYGQKSAQVYIASKAAGITKLEDVKGKKIGSWFGGDEAEFLAMMATVGLTTADVQLQPQQDNPVPQLISGALDVIEEVRYAPADVAALFTKFKPEDLTYLYPEDSKVEPFALFRAADHGADLVKDGLVARRGWVAERPAETQAFVEAALAGWTRAFRQPDAALDLTARIRPDMDRAEQAAQLADIAGLSLTGATLVHGLGYPDPVHVARACAAMAAAEPHAPQPAQAGLVDARFWQAAPAHLRSTCR